MTATPTLDRWRALVEKDLAGKPFDKTLVHEALAGLTVQPLYTDAPKLDEAARHERAQRFRICVRAPKDATTTDLVAESAGGADMVWVDASATGAVAGFVNKTRLTRPRSQRDTSLLVEASAVPTPEAAAEWLEAPFAIDPLAWRARGTAPFTTLAADLAAVAKLDSGVVVSTEPYHDAGADAVDEIAIGLATGAAYVDALLAAGKTRAKVALAIGLRTTVGRDTFVELCKLRALRVCWSKLLAACGVASAAPATIHAVCSAQTLTIRDPWVNMLRVTTQMFAAIIGGADIITPNAFDQAFGEVSELGQRVARNTGLVLREESALGQVSDPAGGSYYFDSLTDALARQAWTRFQELMKAGGIAKLLESGELAKRLEASWKQRLDRLAKRKTPILGTSEFANLTEKLPHPAPKLDAASAGGLPQHREAAAFEALRLRADALKEPSVILVTLGTLAESRPRASFAATFFAAGGLGTREQTDDSTATVVCLCGTDTAYAEEGAKRIAALKAAGAKTVLVAGRGPIDGADGYIFVGSDVVASLSDVLEVLA